MIKQELSNKVLLKNGKIIDCTDLYITPGFVNLHAHSPMNIMKGIAENISIDN
ncbi:MAG: hypothetical protein WBJ13_06185 [Sedimentibacter sp.]